MQFGNDDLAKYTFLPEAGDYFRTLGISITDLTNPDFKQVLNRAEERVMEAIRSRCVSNKTDENREIEIMSFPVSLMLVRSTKLDHLMERYAAAEAARVESFLIQEKRGRIIEEMFQDFLKMQLEHSKIPSFPNFKINLLDYVKRSAQFRKPEYKLVNRTVERGKVYVTQSDLIHLIQAEIRDLIMQRLRAVSVPKLPQEIDSIVKKLIEKAPPPRTAFTSINVSPENFPPCVKEALNQLGRGENVTHYGRFLMATYLLAAGRSVDQIMDLFPKSPDFKKSVTKYQIEHIAGLKGGKTKYTVPSCKTLQTHSFCFKDPIKCYEISSPLQYPSRKTPASGNAKNDVKNLRKEERRGWTKALR